MTGQVGGIVLDYVSLRNGVNVGVTSCICLCILIVCVYMHIDVLLVMLLNKLISTWIHCTYPYVHKVGFSARTQRHLWRPKCSSSGS